MADRSEEYLKSIMENIQIIKNQLGRVVNSMVDAEKEVPEFMRRFIMYMHDVHDIMNMYTEHGSVIPRHVAEEAERCDDRYRQLLEQLHSDGNAFEKVRREMSKDPKNRWDHSRTLPKPTEIKDAKQDP